ncbi:MAG TPA: DUF1203 domain-containing protein [Myxococcales bacterium]
MAFQISALPKVEFEWLFRLSAAQLSAVRGARCIIADRSPGYPCRISLQDAVAGEQVILLNYLHQGAFSPFRASHGIYVRANAEEARLAPCEVPQMLRSRLLSVRAFDAAGMLVDADVVEGVVLESLVERLLRNPSAEYLHVHFARPGCYAARVDRSH